jgi:hypothetical protein
MQKKRNEAAASFFNPIFAIHHAPAFGLPQ